MNSFIDFVCSYWSPKALCEIRGVFKMSTGNVYNEKTLAFKRPLYKNKHKF